MITSKLKAMSVGLKHKKSTTRPKNRVNTELLLINAAKKVFSEKGYSAASTRMIAKEAGVNLSLIARYFGNKQGLLLEVIKSESKVMISTPIPYPPKSTLLEECSAYAEYTFLKNIDRIELFRIVLVQAIIDPTIVKAIQKLDRLNDNREIHARIEKHLQIKNISMNKREIQNFLSLLSRVILGTVTFRYIFFGHSKEKCIRDLKDSIETFGKLENLVIRTSESQ